MKIKVEAGRTVRLGKRRTGARGGTYDLDKLKIPAAEQKRIAGLAGVTEITQAAAKAKEDGK